MALISVIIPTQNRAFYLEKTIDSVLNQTFADFEIIIIDDGSMDNTKELVSKYPNRVKYFFQIKAGVSAARNFGINVSEGEFLAFLDSDDIWRRDKLEKQINLFRENETLSVIHTGIDLIDKTGKKIERKIKSTEYQEGKVFNNLLLDKSWVVLSTLMIKRDCVSKIGLFDEDLITAEDSNFTMKLAKHYSFRFINEALVSKREHSDNLTTNAYAFSEKSGTFINLQKIFELYPDTAKSVRRQSFAIRYFHYGYTNFVNGNCALSQSYFGKSLLYNGINLKTIIYYFLSFIRNVFAF